jgi:pimeloyl-ACP methyl ester carboxylesterase
MANLQSLPPWPNQEVPSLTEPTLRTLEVRCHILEGAGHWIQRERAPVVNDLLLTFLKSL